MSRIDPQQFVEVWMSMYKDASLADIGDRLGVSRQYVEQFSSKLRTRGVNLPKLSKNPRRAREVTPAVIEQLNSLIKENL